ncbi:hypothetical protein D1P53_000062 [Cryptococcus gattii VGV]|nr:hypothetical protein D1P53_000062 [Cryptococcus gattii VGV]
MIPLKDYTVTLNAMSLVDLPCEVISMIARTIYDPLTITQKDRLNMDQDRQNSLDTLIALGMTCRKIRREVKGILFTCVRVHDQDKGLELIENRETWGIYVRSIIIDLSMFDNTSDQFIKQNNMIGTLRPRSCWSESTFLETLINSLPQLEHLCFFADVSDDPTLVLLFSKLIPIPSSYLSQPAPTSLDSLSSSHLQHAPPRHIHKPFSLRLRSFSWRLRAPPPSTFRKFARSSTFVSIHHLVRHTPNLEFLVLDADMDYTASPDILAVLEQLAERDKWAESRPPKLSLMLCGPILGWGDIFLKDLVKAYSNIKELFIDRPLTSPLVLDQVGALDFLVGDLLPLSCLPHLQILQIGSYQIPSDSNTQRIFHVTCLLSRYIPSLRIFGVLDPSGETVWGGIWPETLRTAVGTRAAEASMDEAEGGKSNRCWGVDEETGKWFFGLGDRDLEALVRDG